MVAYADTSFILSLYTADANHQAAVDLVTRVHSALPFTSFQRHEVRNAVRLQVFRKDMTKLQRDAVLQNLDTDVQDGFLVHAGLPWTDAFTEAEMLSATYTEKLGIRGMDVLHVALARTMGAEVFLTFDARQKALASTAGMAVEP